jgi:hypothetical protein
MDFVIESDGPSESAAANWLFSVTRLAGGMVNLYGSVQPFVSIYYIVPENVGLRPTFSRSGSKLMDSLAPLVRSRARIRVSANDLKSGVSQGTRVSVPGRHFTSNESDELDLYLYYRFFRASFKYVLGNTKLREATYKGSRDVEVALAYRAQVS